MTAYKFWAHTRSGEVYAVRLEGFRVTGARGPLPLPTARLHRELERFLPYFHYDDDRDGPALADSIDADQDSYGLVE